MALYTATCKIIRQLKNETDAAFTARIDAELDKFSGSEQAPTVSITCHTYGIMIAAITLPKLK